MYDIEYCEGFLQNWARHLFFPSKIFFTDKASFSIDGMFKYWNSQV